MISNKQTNGCSVFYEANNNLCDINGATHISIFQGVMPDLKTLSMTAANYSITGAHVASQLGLVDADCLGILACPPLSNSYEYGAEGATVRIPTSSILSDLVGLKSGTPTFFVLTTTRSARAQTFAGTFNTLVLDNVFLGTVSDVAGEGELRILGGDIQEGVRYRLTDLTFHV